MQTCGLSGRSYTFGQLFNKSQNFGANLKRNLGLKNGDVVALILPNLPEFAIAFYGAASAGLVTTFANPIYTEGNYMSERIIMRKLKVFTVSIGKTISVTRNFKNIIYFY